MTKSEFMRLIKQLLYSAERLKEYRKYLVPVANGICQGGDSMSLVAGSSANSLFLNLARNRVTFDCRGKKAALRQKLEVDVQVQQDTSRNVDGVEITIPKPSKNPDPECGIAVVMPTGVQFSEKNDDISENDKDKIVGSFGKFIKLLVDRKMVDEPNVKKETKPKARGNALAMRNLIVFGAPGTGKSRYLNELRLKKHGEVDEDVDPDRSNDLYFDDVDRVTFYPTYSYAQFVGSYKPYMAEVDKDGFEPGQDAKKRKVIAYKFVPGPFLRILVKALLNPDERNYLLIIEEINRANAAAVFGDMFQLLDRRAQDDAEGDEGESEYAITPSEEVQEYLKGAGIAEPSELRIPGNLYIWATMNSADQGVFPLDTAFKRRWDFKYLSLDETPGNNKVNKIDVECGSKSLCKWGDLRKAINSLLARNRINEDKHLSAYFVKPDGEDRISSERFKMKVLMYLWEDAARMCRTQVFNKSIRTFSELIKAWDDVKPSKTDDANKPLGGDNPLESVFSFGTEKCESVSVTSDETPGNQGGNEGNGETGNDPAKEGGVADAEEGKQAQVAAQPANPPADDNDQEVVNVEKGANGKAPVANDGQA